jgi:carboxylesterase
MTDQETVKDDSPDAPAAGAHRGTKSWLKRALLLLVAVLGVALIVFLVLALVPSSSEGMESEQDPASTYDEAVARLERVQQDEEGKVNEAGGSLLLGHGRRTPRAYVMVHGTTNSPKQWAELGETLYAQGDNVLILRLPFHGLKSHSVSELENLTPQALREYADEAVDIASGLGEEVVVIGISGGGAVASWMALNRPEVDKALLLAPFFGIHGVPTVVTPLLVNAFSHLPNFVLKNPTEEEHPWVYRGEATRGVAAFLALAGSVVNKAKEGVAPAAKVIVLTTASDDTANNDATSQVAELWHQAGADVVQHVIAENEGVPHNSIDPAADPTTKQLVYDLILDLLGEEAPPGPD